MATLYERLTDEYTASNARQREIIGEYAGNPLVQDAIAGRPFGDEIAMLEGYRWRRIFHKDPALEERFAAAREIVDLRPGWDEIIGVSFTSLGVGGQLGLYLYDQGVTAGGAALVTMMVAAGVYALLDLVLSNPVQSQIVSGRIAETYSPGAPTVPR